MSNQWLVVKVHPTAGKSAVLNTAPGRYEVWVKAKPVDGRANDAVVALLARTLGVSRGRLRLVQGHRGRQKVFHLLES